MRTINLMAMMAIIVALSTSCTTQGRSASVTQTTHDTYPAKNPQSVSLYTKDKKPNAAYRIIGIAKVAKYDIHGVQRRNEMVHSMMKNLAASIGGDGLIDENCIGNDVQAKVIAYQKILII